MLSYQHGYHAGNFADVLKHLTQVLIMQYLTQKDKPLFYLETHAGQGLYDLRGKQSQKTAEFKDGITLFFEKRKTLPPVFHPYIQAIEQLNPDGFLRYYPGSPYLAIEGLRDIDRLFCCELHPGEFEGLQELPHRGMRFHCSESDGLQNMKALLPPPEKRGLIFVDPSFECKEEYRKIPKMIKETHAKFTTGVYVLWYPHIDKSYTEQLQKIMKSIPAPSLNVFFRLHDREKPGMKGCGLWIINPPYTLASELNKAKSTICTILKGELTLEE